ncbi:Succinate-acetate/proton symporter SatP [Seminavis robusta]|uniref:Succinate-acetate/proton symporter SatP n=1 Tax=Seminavis robusta TaxID=568900 RepID=A0A9N8DKI2_9STRA|nr:Succinate-acetate/proton symporter SatP [Seminavis robusta]|eukprot:Sro191_g082390.1 Succinate-acetate/proton symporter SatP (248) ;mRNA; f:88012-88755
MMEDTKAEVGLGDLVKELNSLKPHIKPQVPNPAPLGLIGFGLTTALLQMKHTTIAGDSDVDKEGVDALTLGYAMFFGGLIQLVAGLGEVRRNNLFGYTAFCLYGAFWMSLGTVEIVQLLADDAPAVNPKALQCMLFLVAVFTTMLWICTFKMHLTINMLFFMLASTCYLLSAGVRNETVDKVAGYFGLVTAAIAYWLAAAELINEILGEGTEIIPLGRFNFQWLNRTKKDKVKCETAAEAVQTVEEA